jgi:hypothetical protein
MDLLLAMAPRQHFSSQCSLACSSTNRAEEGVNWQHICLFRKAISLNCPELIHNISAMDQAFAFTFSFESMPAAVSVAFLGCGNNIGTTSHGKPSVKQIDWSLKSYSCSQEDYLVLL